MAPLRRLVHPTLAALRREELVHRKDGVSRQHVIHSPPDLVREYREGFALAMSAFQTRLEPLALAVLPEERDCSFRERPFQMDVALLRTTPADDLAGGFMAALHQARSLREGRGPPFDHCSRSAARLSSPRPGG